MIGEAGGRQYVSEHNRSILAFRNYINKARGRFSFNSVCRQRNNNLYVWQLTRKTEPRPQGFTPKKWVGRPTQFLREKPWGRG